jgi:PTS system nitrogen regulatory IIA component
MTRAAELLCPARAVCKADLPSKKRALEHAAGLLAPSLTGMSRLAIFDALNTRERLGSTGLGHGMALPHGRVTALPEPIAACLTLAQPIDFNAPDRQGVDVLFVLLVPATCSDEHLRIVAGLAEMFNDAGLREALRGQTEPNGLIEVLANWSAEAGARSAG